jgi:hypothetical protein
MRYELTIRNKYATTEVRDLKEMIQYLEAHVAYLKELEAAGVKYVGGMADDHATFETYDLRIANDLGFVQADEADADEPHTDLADDIEPDISEEPRPLSQILDALDVLFKQVWYTRHSYVRSRIEEGKHRIVPEAEYSPHPYRDDQTVATVWAEALKAAKKTEEEVGLENLGPWDDFEWGVINGKLSALRWVLGDEWDNFDT